MTSQFDFSSLPVVRQKSITGAELAEEPQFHSIRDERALMASEGLSEHLESALVAAAGGDALGWITEMNQTPSGLWRIIGSSWLTDFADWSKSAGAGGGIRYVDRVRKGEYSDDTQLTLAVFRSLRGDGSFDGDHFTGRELAMYLDYARGAGRATVGACLACRRQPTRWNDNFFTYGHRGQRDYRSGGGNGAAMRVAPVALANLRNPERLADGAWRSSVATHGHPTAVLGSLLYAHALRLCLERREPVARTDLVGELIPVIAGAAPPPAPEFEHWVNVWNRAYHLVWGELPFEELLDKKAREVIGELERLADLPSEPGSTRAFMEELGCFSGGTFGSGTGTTLAALAIYLQDRKDHRSAIPWAANQLGSDTDSIAGFVGGMLGASYGREAVPPHWFHQVQDSRYLAYAASCLERVINGRTDAGDNFLPEPADEDARLPQLPDCLESQDLAAGDRVFHPILGAGEIENTETQLNGRLRLTRVTFDQSQTCKFKHVVP